MKTMDGVARSGGWITLPGLGRVNHSVRNPSEGDGQLPYQILLALSVFNLRRFALLTNLARNKQLDIDDERLDGLVQTLAKKPIDEGRPEGEIAGILAAYGKQIAAYSHICTWNDLTVDGIECNPTLYSDVPLRLAVDTLRANLESVRLLTHVPAAPPAPAIPPETQSELDAAFGPRQPAGPSAAPAPPAVPGMAVKFDYRQKDNYADGQLVEIDIATIKRESSNKGDAMYKFQRARSQYPEGKLTVYEDNERVPEAVKQFLTGLRLPMGGSISGAYKVVFQVAADSERTYWNIQSIGGA